MFLRLLSTEKVRAVFTTKKNNEDDEDDDAGDETKNAKNKDTEVDKDFNGEKGDDDDESDDDDDDDKESDEDDEEKIAADDDEVEENGLEENGAEDGKSHIWRNCSSFLDRLNFFYIKHSINVYFKTSTVWYEKYIPIFPSKSCNNV